MRSIPIDNRIYGGKLARVGDGIRGCSSTRELAEMEASAPRQTLKLSSSLSLFRLLYPRSLVFSTCSVFSCTSLSLSLPLLLSFPLSPSLSISLIPISSFSSFSPPPVPSALFRRLNQPAEEPARSGEGEGRRRGRRGRLQKDR